MWEDIKFAMAVIGYVVFLVGAVITLGAIILFVSPYIKTPLGAFIVGSATMSVAGLIIWLTRDR